ncbi:MAG: two-component regulator propeller domain-containing protein, partial [Lutibacter sp.]
MISIFIEAQELPPIENYLPKVYAAENQNWSISQSSEKYIYVANNSGLLEFNGADWKLYPSPNNTILRSVNVIGNRVYTGSYMEFGYWIKNEFGNLVYYSLSEKLKEPLLEEEFWNIIEFDNWILFQSLHRIYIYNTVDEKFNIINSKTNLPKVFKVSGSVFYQKMNEGIYKIENGKPVLVSNHPILQNNIIVNIFIHHKRILFQTQDKGFYFLDEEKKLSNWDFPLNNEIASKSVYSSLQLVDGSFVIGTITNGIYHLDIDGNLIDKINQENGLNNNTVLSMFEDSEHNVWLGLDNGISVINYNSPFSVYNDIHGKLGTVYTSAIFNNKLYLGSNQGLFYKNVNSNDDFNYIKNTNGQVWCLKVIDNTLFCGHNAGTFIVNNNNAELIADKMGTWDIKPIKGKENLLIQG